jgi:hypothetical protein
MEAKCILILNLHKQSIMLGDTVIKQVKNVDTLAVVSLTMVELIAQTFETPLNCP